MRSTHYTCSPGRGAAAGTKAALDLVISVDKAQNNCLCANGSTFVSIVMLTSGCHHVGLLLAHH